MTQFPDSADPPLAADDPRISEWLDGRLPPAAAAEVERAVRGSPELTRLVNDLRAMRGALRGLPVAGPPAGFSGRVMAAVEQRSRATAGDREGGRSPFGESPRRRPGIWRAWPALAAALAGGVLAAIVFNLPGPGDREVALGPDLREMADDAWTPVEPEQNAAAVAIAPPAEMQARRTLAAEEAVPRPAAAAAPGEAADKAEKRGLQQPRQAVAGVLAIEVGSPSGLQALDRLVAASGLEVTQAGARLELMGPAAVTNAFLDELERAGLLRASPRREAKGAAGESDQTVRLVIRIVDPRRSDAGESHP